MLALLAAGQSRRFGDQDKLTALLGGKMLGLHAAEAGAAIHCPQKRVIGPPAHGCARRWNDLGYRIIVNEQAHLGQATSVRLAASHAIEAGARALYIMLADMPFVTADHINRLLAIFEQMGCTRTIASARDGQAMPPAIFPNSALNDLLTLEGDSGARALLSDAHLVTADDPILMDIDSEEDLAQANIIYRAIP
ncbi:nucleotidyltransferase family protein [Parasphingorhabdus sp.]|uniref:nucleotidyltransferase family protein n=1 Tax=Parasphingorhabdus sp. TaxID=2709688 RepID=UPI003266D935